MDTSERYIKMCESAKEIQRIWNYENGDYIFDLFDGEARTWFWYHSKDVSEYIWLPRHDQLQEICTEFFIPNLKISRRKAFLKFLEWYASCLMETFEHGHNDFIDSSEEILLNRAMTMILGKKWDGKGWVKSLMGYS